MNDILKNPFGFELLNQIHCGQVSTKEDVLVLFTHWFFVRCGFKCLGIGDSRTISPDERGSEKLPVGWNQIPNQTLRYVKDAKLYLLELTKTESTLLLNQSRVDEGQTSSLQLGLDTVQSLEGPLDSLMPDYKTTIQQLYSEFIVPVQLVDRCEISTQTSAPERPPGDDDPLRMSHDMDVLRQNDFWQYPTF